MSVRHSHVPQVKSLTSQARNAVYRSVWSFITRAVRACVPASLLNAKHFIDVDYAQWLQTPEQLTAHLLHHLCNNAHEVSLLRTYVRDPLRDLSVNDATMNWVHTAAGPPIKLSRIWHELLDLPNVITSPRLQAHMLADGFSSLTVDDWLCRSCLTAVLRQRLWIWWWNEKARGRAVGAPLLQDCWCAGFSHSRSISHAGGAARYGYECWTQVKIPSHGAKLNVRVLSLGKNMTLTRLSRVASLCEYECGEAGCEEGEGCRIGR